MSDNTNEELDQTTVGEESNPSEGSDQTGVDENSSQPKPFNTKVVLIIAAAILGFVIIGGVIWSMLPPTPVGIPSGYAVDKNELIQNEKRLVGEVISVVPGSDNSGTIEIRSHILDLSTEDDYIAETDLIYVEQNKVVSFDQQTTFKNKNVSDLKEGDVVQIDTTESIYLAESLKAAKVYYYDEQAETIKQILGNANVLSGNIKEITKDSVIVTAEVVDVEELEQMDFSGSYAVPFEIKDITLQVNTDTTFATGSFAELMVGEKVLVTTTDSIYEGEVETALEISIISPEPDDGPLDY